MAMQRPIPRDTNRLFQQHLGTCRNLGLLLDKFNPWQQQRDGSWKLSFTVEEQRRGQGQRVEKNEGEAKRLWLSDGSTDNRVQLVDRPLAPNSRIDQALLAAHYQRWHSTVQILGAEHFELTSNARLVVGLGGESTLETALTLHHVYGFPVIPGSALKGLSRTVAFFEVAQSLGINALDAELLQRYKDKEKQTALEKLETLLESDLNDHKTVEPLLVYIQKQKHALTADAKVQSLSPTSFASEVQVRNFQTTFGYLGQAGSVIFLDAMPVTVPRFELDVMNPHYPDYYRDTDNRTPPADDQSPNPVAFLTVAAGASFGFALVPRRNYKAQDRDAVTKAKSWILYGLQEVGIGAKTAAGYGVFG